MLRNLVDTVVLACILDPSLLYHRRKLGQRCRPAGTAWNKMKGEQPLPVLSRRFELRIELFQLIDLLSARLHFSTRFLDGILKREVFGTHRPIKDEEKQEIDDANHTQQTCEYKLLPLAPIHSHRASFCGL